MSSYDVIVVGSGAGGGTLVHRLAPTGKVDDHLAERLGVESGAAKEAANAP
jgi:choline dehydrogenase-like flavoprotein